MRKLMSILCFIFILRYLSYLDINIESLFYPFAYLARESRIALLGITGSQEISNSLFGDLYVMVITYTVLRILLSLGLLSVLIYVSRIFRILGFSSFESIFIIIKAIFGQMETALFFNKNISKLSTKDLYILCTASMNVISLSALSVYYILIPEHIYTIFISHILGIFLSILVINILFNDTNEQLDLSNPYDDHNFVDALMNGITYGSLIVLSISAIIIGISVFTHIIQDLSPITLNNDGILKKYLIAIFTNEFVLLKNFTISRPLVVLLVNFTNVGCIGMGLAAIRMSNPSLKIGNVMINSFFISIACNIMKMIILY